MQLPYFWDNISIVNRFALHFFENGLFPLTVPPQIDHGHPPLLGWLVAVNYKTFGLNLISAHLTMLPFLLLIAWQWCQLVKQILTPEFWWIGLLALFAEPSFLAHSTMVSPEIVLIAGALFAINGILQNNNYYRFIGLTLLGFSSIRGSIWCVVFALTEFVLMLNKNQQSKNEFLFNFKKIALPYFTAAFLIIVWYTYHYLVQGFIFSPPDSTWAARHQWKLDSNIFYHLKMLHWAMLDYGRVFVWALAIIVTIYHLFLKKMAQSLGKQKTQKNQQIKTLISFCIIGFIAMSIVMLLRSGNVHQRYLMPLFMLGFLMFIYYAININLKWLSYSVLALAFTALFSGHLWIYPPRYTQAWDASLAHLPYFQLRQNAMDYLSKDNININEVGTAFPTYNSLYLTDLKVENKEKFTSLSQELKGQYILDSNIQNTLLPQHRELLQRSSQFQLIWQEEKRGVWMKLYQNFEMSH